MSTIHLDGKPVACTVEDRARWDAAVRAKGSKFATLEEAAAAELAPKAKPEQKPKPSGQAAERE